jgi:hypothetical protein
MTRSLQQSKARRSPRQFHGPCWFNSPIPQILGVNPNKGPPKDKKKITIDPILNHGFVWHLSKFLSFGDQQYFAHSLFHVRSTRVNQWNLSRGFGRGWPRESIERLSFWNIIMYIWTLYITIYLYVYII